MTEAWTSSPVDPAPADAPSGDAPARVDRTVQVERAGAVATVTLNRPAHLNGLDTATKVALRDALDEVAGDSGVRCVVLTGSGRAFCVGQDLREHAEALRQGAGGALTTTVEEHYNPIVTSLLTMAKPVVAAVNGVAAGAGASLALACDLRLVADTAGFNLAFAGIGLSCDSGTSWTLPRIVGRAKALELLFEPRTIGAEEAQVLGLATRVVPAADLTAEAAALAGRLAAGPTQAYAAIRRAVTYSATAPLPDALALEAELMGQTGGTQDHRDAVESFLAKRPPTFTGR